MWNIIRRLWSSRGRSTAHFNSKLRPSGVVMCACAGMVMLNACIFAASASSTVAGAVTNITTNTTTTTTTASGPCAAVTICLDDEQCAACLRAINSTSYFQHSLAQLAALSAPAYKEQDIEFFHALWDTPSCTASPDSSNKIYNALQMLFTFGGDCQFYGMNVNDCQNAMVICFANAQCRLCLKMVYSGNATKSEALNSSLCTNPDPESTIVLLISDVQSACTSFPQCTYTKLLCSQEPRCRHCLDTLSAGDGAEAARQCKGGLAAFELASAIVAAVVSYCIQSDGVACDYYRQRCAQSPYCGACLAAVGAGESMTSIAEDWLTPSCQAVMASDDDLSILQSVVQECPYYGNCRSAVLNCMNGNLKGGACYNCILDLPPPGDDDDVNCSFLAHEYGYDVACKTCSDSVDVINSIVLATAVVGLASATICIAVVVTVVAHGRDRASMRDRIVIGLMLANGVYSSANTIPLNAMRTGVLDCGRLAMSFDVIRFGRAWWFAGKYGLVCFELFIVGASIRALHRGLRAMQPRAEAMLHAACWAVAVLAFAVFYTLCADINAAGYNFDTEKVAFYGEYDHSSLTDDRDDDAAAFVASAKFASARDKYDALIQEMLVAWDVLVGIAITLWFVLRSMHRNVLRALLADMAAVLEAEAQDVWAHTRRSAWGDRRRLLLAQQEAFSEVAKPLEPYLIVFVVFAVPAFVMSTSFCQRRSGAQTQQLTAEAGGFGTSGFTYGACDVSCELVLAFRSICTVVVYLLPRERRSELIKVCTTWRKLRSRIIGSFYCRNVPYATLDDEDEGREMMDLAHNRSVVDAPDDGTTAMVEESPWRISECDIIKTREVGHGAFGDVWEGVLLPFQRPVAIKMLRAGGFDEEGDAVHDEADEDLRHECAILQRVNNPHLLTFFGFGFTTSGHGFIVTELMVGGSLESALLDTKQDMSWRTRVAYALQVALAMQHLHDIQLVHRDLKSANVLLDEPRIKAKVCDFGLTRLSRPRPRQHIVHSPFTGVTRRIVSTRGSIEISDSNTSALSAVTDIVVSIEDAHGTMTKAMGTLLWMAPEVFRGDLTYGPPVDVYSFGILLCELANRQHPWRELSSESATFFDELNRALQTGRRPAIPQSVVTDHPAFVTVMHNCCAGDPIDRPTFTDVASALAAILSTSLRK